MKVNAPPVSEKMLAAEATRRILCLHGRGGSADSFTLRAIAPLRDAAAASYGIPGQSRRAVAWEFEALDSEDDAGAWWTYPSGQRSYSATEYYGAQGSIERVEKALATGRYNGLLGFSQGVRHLCF